MRAVAYCRVSTNDTDQLNSLSNQMQHYNELFSNKEYTPVKAGMLYKKNGESQYLESIFADEGITGTKKKNRKAFEYMLQCAERREFDIIFVKNVQRFSRNAEYGLGCLKRLKQLDIKVFFEEGGLDSSNTSHEVIIGILLNLSQQESQSKSIACKFGIRKAQDQGKWTSNTPYGYDRINGYLKVNPTEANIVENIYNLYLNKGYGHKKIIDYLTDNDIPTKKGGVWHTQHVKHILSNPLYTGIQTTHKSENMDTNIKKIKDIPEENWIVKEIEELKIIDNEMWQSVQDMAKRKLDSMTKSKSRPSSTHLFSTMIKCTNCGGILRRKQKRTKLNQKMVWLDEYEWVCQNNDMKGTKVCKNRNAIDESILIDFVKNEIVEYRKNIQLQNILFDEYLKSNFTYDQDRVNQLNGELSELKQEFNNKIRLNGKGIITDEELEVYNKEYRKQTAELDRELLKYKNINSEIEHAKRNYKEFINYINRVDLNNLTNVDLKKIFVRLNISTLYDTLNDDCTFTDKYKKLDKYQYKWINQSKKTVKILVSEFMFMDAEVSKLIF